jgi:DNA-binding XRE family transcriptional regulator
LLNVPITLKAKKAKEYSKTPQTLGEHLKKRRKALGLLQREVAQRMGVNTWTYLNWEKGKTKPVASQFRPVIEFLGYDPMAQPKTLADRLQARRRTTGSYS